MGKLKKGGQDTRGQKAKAQKAAALQEKQQALDKERKKKEDASWNIGTNKRSQLRQKNAFEKEEERKMKALEKKALLAAEEAEMENMKKPKGKARKAQKAKKKKNDFSALDAYLQEEQKSKQKKLNARNKISEMQSLTKNRNRQKADEEAKGIYSATGIDEAINALNIAQKQGESAEKHPEKRAKAAYAAFEERRMPEIKVEYPGLKRSQYKEKLWKEWQKSPENPFNQQNE